MTEVPRLTAEELTALAAEPDRVRRGLALLALLGERIGEVPIVVGGFAVETYTQGGYTTADVDVLFRRRDAACAALLASGFERQARHYVRDDLGLAVEFPGGVLDPPEAYDRVVEIVVGGRRVTMIGPEDLLIDRLCQYVHGDVADERELALMLAALHQERLDLDYLRASAERESISEQLEQVLVDAREALS